MREASGLTHPYDSRVDNATRVEELYTAHVRLVRSVCRSLLRNRNEAEDAVQQTFLSAQRALANGSSPREPAAWLATIARNECLARVRERMREPLPVEAEPTDFGADAHSAAVSRYEMATLREALADLPRAQREAILLRELRGLSYDEVARALSVTTAAVESLIFRARRTLQVKLSEALTAFSPFVYFGRFLGGGGSDLAGPAVAKIAVIGAGAALLAGGAALGPRALGLGHHAAPKAHRSAQPARVRAAPPIISTPPTHIWANPAAKAPETKSTENDASAVENFSETTSSDTGESSASDDGNATTSTAASTPPAHEGTGGSDGSSSDDSGSDDSSLDGSSSDDSGSDGSGPDN